MNRVRGMSLARTVMGLNIGCVHVNSGKQDHTPTRFRRGSGSRSPLFTQGT